MNIRPTFNFKDFSLKLLAFLALVFLAPCFTKYVVRAEDFLANDQFAKLDGNYYTLNDALCLAKDGSVIEFYGNLIDCDIIIPEKVTLIIPYDNEGNFYCEDFAELSDAPNTFTVEIKKDVKITVNGRFIIGGQTNMTTGEKSNIAKVINNGEIFVNGEMFVYGEVTKGLITVNKDGQLYQPFIVKDYLKENLAYQDSFYYYCYNSLKCDVNIFYGGYLKGITNTDQKIVNIVAPFLCKGFLTIKNGKITIKYDENKSILRQLKTIDLSNIGVTSFIIDGDVSMQYPELLKDDLIDDDYVFGIPYNFSIEVNENSYLEIPKGYDFKLLPGGEIITHKNASLVVNGSLYVYDGFINSGFSEVIYPTNQILYEYGFSKCGMLVNNGTLIINGSFLGTVQSGLLDSTIITGENPKLHGLVTEGFSKDNKASLTSFYLSAKVYGFDEFCYLEENSTYKSVAISPFSIKNITMELILTGDNISGFTYLYGSQLEVNQTLTGRYLKVQDDGYEATVNFYVGEAKEKVLITIGENTYKTDQNGKVRAKVRISKDLSVSYNTYLKELNKNLAFITFDGDTILNKVIKDSTLSSDNQTIVDLSITVNQYYADINCYGGLTYKVPVYSDDFYSERYVKTVAFKNEDYPVTNNLSCDICYVKQELKNYKNGVNGLIDSLNISKDAKVLYETYLCLYKDKTGKEAEFINGYLKDLPNYFNIVTDFYLISPMYGRLYEEATLYTVCDEFTGQVKLSGYEFKDGCICGSYVYTFNYLDKEYLIEGESNKVLPFEAVYKIDNVKSIYGEDIANLTGSFINFNQEDYIYDLVNEAILNDSIEVYTDADVLSDIGIYGIYGKNLSSYFNLSFINGTYKILRKTVSVTVNDLTIREGDEYVLLNCVCSDKIIQVDWFDIYKDDQKIGEVDKNGKISVKLGIGVYQIYPNNKNYFFDCTPSSINVIEKSDEYIVAFGFSEGDCKIYDGNEFSFNIAITDKNTGERLNGDIFTVQIFADGNLVDKILNAGKYLVKVTVNQSVFSRVFIVKQKGIVVKIQDEIVYYGDNPQLKVVSTSLDYDLTDKIVVSIGENGSLYGKSLDNNFYVESVEGEYKVIKRPIKVKLNDVTVVYGQAQPPLTAVLLEGELCENQSLNKIIHISREQGDKVGSYRIFIDNIAEGYEVDVIEGLYEVTPKNLYVSIDDKTSVYGESQVALSYKIVIGNLCYDDCPEQVFALTKLEGSDVGQYLITGQSLNANYQVNFCQGIYNITKRPLTVYVSSGSGLYGDQFDLYDLITVKGAIYNHTSKDLVGFLQPTCFEVGKHQIICEPKNDNYLTTIVYDGDDSSYYEIAPKPLKVVIGDLTTLTTDCFIDVYSKLSYGVEGFDVSLSLQYFIYKDDTVLTADNFESFYMTGDYLVTANCDNKNYLIDFVNGCLTVVKQDISSGIKIEVEPGGFAIVNKTLVQVDLAPAKEYNLTLYLDNQVVSTIDKQGLYKVVVEVVDDKYSGSAELTFYGYQDVKPKIDEVKLAINNFKSSKTLADLLIIKNLVLNMCEGDILQINCDDDYTKVLEEYSRLYTEFYNDKKQNLTMGVTVYNRLIGEDFVVLAMTTLSLIGLFIVYKRW